MTYTLLHAPLGYLDDNPDARHGEHSLGKPHSTHDTLTGAMTAAGHPEPRDWHTATGIPDHVYLDCRLHFESGRAEYIAQGRGTAEDYERYNEHDELIYLQPRWVITGPGAATEFHAMIGLRGVASQGWAQEGAPQRYDLTMTGRYLVVHSGQAIPVRCQVCGAEAGLRLRGAVTDAEVEVADVQGHTWREPLVTGRDLQAAWRRTRSAGQGS